MNVFWDMGGTLVDTYPALDAAFRDVVQRHGGEIELVAISRLTRTSTGEAIAALAERFGIDEQEFKDANARLKKQWETTPPPVMAGAKELMSDVRDAGGLNLVVTHRERTSAEALIVGVGLQVDDLICASDGFERKPAPDMYLELLHRHGLDATECLGVGDRPIDAVAAHRAGMKAAMLENPELPVEDDADFHVGRLADLRHIVLSEE